MMQYLEEYNRLVGVGPSLREQSSIDPMYRVLAKAFSVRRVGPEDIRFLRYRQVGKGVELEDVASRFGGILTSIEPKEASPSEVVSFLKKHGAKAIKSEGLQEGILDFKTGHPNLDSAVLWMLKKGRVSTLSDGTVEYFFQGNLPSRMMDVFWRAKKDGVLKTRDTSSAFTFYWEGPVATFALTAGTKMGSQNRVKFNASDYTVPASKHEDEDLPDGFDTALEEIQYPQPGLFGKEYEQTLKKGYVNLHLVNPKFAKTLKAHVIAEGILAAMFHNRKPVAYIKDPQNILKISGMKVGELKKAVQLEWYGYFYEEAGYAGEYDDQKLMNKYQEAAEIMMKSNVKIDPIKGKAGTPGYKVTMGTDPFKFMK